MDILDFHARAVQTPSHEDVTDMQALLVDTLESEGFDASIDEAGNVISTRGTGRPHLVLNTHLDTVAPHVPYERDGDVITGRGACDAKGPLAAMVAAFVGAEISDGRVTLAITPDEETTQTGAQSVTETLDGDVDIVIVGEPTGLDVCHAARGQFEGTITLDGESAHAADPASGANAISAVGPILEALESYDSTSGPGTHPTLGSPTLTPTMIEGGEVPNQIPATCTITFDRRSVPPETSGGFPEDLQAHLPDYLPDDISASVELLNADTPFPEAFETPPDESIVETLRDISGGDVRPFGAATEAAQFAEIAPTVVFGPGVLTDDEGPVAHSPREYVEREDLEQAEEILTQAVETVLAR